MCFDRNVNGNRDVKSLECDYLLVQQCVKLTLVKKFKRFKKNYDLKLQNRSDTLDNNVDCDVVLQDEAIHKICKE